MSSKIAFRGFESPLIDQVERLLEDYDPTDIDRKYDPKLVVAHEALCRLTRAFELNYRLRSHSVSALNSKDSSDDENEDFEPSTLKLYDPLCTLPVQIEQQPHTLRAYEDVMLGSQIVVYETLCMMSSSTHRTKDKPQSVHLQGSLVITDSFIIPDTDIRFKEGLHDVFIPLQGLLIARK